MVPTHLGLVLVPIQVLLPASIPCSMPENPLLPGGRLYPKKAGLINIRSGVSFNPLPSFMHGRLQYKKKTDNPVFCFDVLWSLNFSVTSLGILCTMNPPLPVLLHSYIFLILNPHFSLHFHPSSCTGVCSLRLAYWAGTLQDHCSSAWGKLMGFSPLQLPHRRRRKQPETAARKHK